ncbi:hypothetical protein G6O67_000751 [Ophiocordyceps sinensis]|uniref:Uncharacterized protein n=1 Tax=Ophiocordyceps sinensis TaxID=72228 RepID=A0A8H4VAA2_9HYPO|nr:hypothetical protein G6O67_000751 [Ophiocordyceps sinensis]
MAESIAKQPPDWLQGTARALLPALSLPRTVVFKKIKPGWEDPFELEKKIYRELGDIQGNVMPKFFGEAKCRGFRTLVLSRVDGVLPWRASGSPHHAAGTRE